jgi:hypothetical protein
MGEVEYRKDLEKQEEAVHEYTRKSTNRENE